MPKSEVVSRGPGEPGRREISGAAWQALSTAQKESLIGVGGGHLFRAMREVVDDFEHYRDSIDITIDKMRDLAGMEGDGGEALLAARRWLGDELRMHLAAIFRLMPRCWGHDAKNRERFERWYAALDDIIGPSDSRDATTHELDGGKR